MMNVRIVLVTLLCLVCAPALLIAKPTKQQIQAAATKCDAEFDQALDNCLGGGWQPNECLETAASVRAKCMREQGIEARYVPKIGASHLLPAKRKQFRDEVAPAKQTPNKPRETEPLKDEKREAAAAPATLKPAVKEVGKNPDTIKKSEKPTPEPSKTPKPVS